MSIAVSAVAMIAGMVYSTYAVDRTKARLDERIEAGRQCMRLRPAMTRDEVIQVMGQPLKQYDVRPDGKEGDAVFREFIYPVPAPGQAAYVDFDIETMRAVEIFCRPDFRLSLGAAGLERIKAGQAIPAADGAAAPSTVR